MKKFTLFLLALSATVASSAQQYGSLWRFSNATQGGKPLLNATLYKALTTDEHTLYGFLTTVMTDANNPATISLPTPDGALRPFYIWETPIMERSLGEKYTSIHTYTASAVDNHLVTAKIDYTPFGFHAMIADGDHTFFIDPFGSTADGNYISYYRKDYKGDAVSRPICQVGKGGTTPGYTDPIDLNGTHMPSLGMRVNGTMKRTYRLALACTGEYAVKVAGPNPTKAAVLAKMITTMNRVNSVYERDLAVTMQLVANEDTLIFLDGNNDPYDNNNATSMLSTNPFVVDNRIKTENYDIGHILGTGAGGSGSGLGIANVGAVCNQFTKAGGVTGTPNPTGDAFDIDFVAHEMGHQFGAQHSFNSSFSGDCNSAAFAPSAYEPGSGSTIMGYAGICGNENIQAHTDPYFHSISLEQITNYLATTSCASVSISGNTNAVIPPFNATYAIPYLTAFELTAPEAIDATADEVTYCWEQRNLGDFGKSITQTSLYGPQFRSFMPSASRTRIFPSIDSLLKSVFISKQEKIADAARSFCFRLTERDIYQGFGCFNFPDDSIHLDVINTGTPFKITMPNASVNWASGSAQTVTWNVSGTDMPPINCSNVDIYLSTDGGYTFPTLLVANTPNDGSEPIQLPNADMSKMRIKVKAVNNVFFAISHTTPPTNVKHPVPLSEVSVIPVPAERLVRIQFVQAGQVSFARVFSTTGQMVWSGTIVDHEVIDISSWAKGIYFLRLMNDDAVDVMRPIMVK